MLTLTEITNTRIALETLGLDIRDAVAVLDPAQATIVDAWETISNKEAPILIFPFQLLPNDTPDKIREMFNDETEEMAAFAVANVSNVSIGFIKTNPIPEN